jgi:hypothetical protein
MGLPRPTKEHPGRRIYVYALHSRILRYPRPLPGPNASGDDRVKENNVPVLPRLRQGSGPYNVRPIELM